MPEPTCTTFTIQIKTHSVLSHLADTKQFPVLNASQGAKVYKPVPFVFKYQLKYLHSYHSSLTSIHRRHGQLDSATESELRFYDSLVLNYLEKIHRVTLDIFWRVVHIRTQVPGFRCHYVLLKYLHKVNLSLILVTDTKGYFELPRSQKLVSRC